jgi:hypothetical protein
MKKPLYLLFLFLTSFQVQAQNLSPTIINSTGGSGTINGIVYDYSFGEMTMIQTFSTPNLIVTQGLLQTKTDTSATGINNHQLQALVITVFPNPAQQTVCFESDYQSPGKLQYELIDVAGKTIIGKELNSVTGKIKETINVSDLPAGVYLLKVTMTHNKEIFTQTLKIQKN